MGDDLPVLLRDPPSEELKEHWSKVLSFFPAADIRQLDEEDTGYKTIVTNYPLQSLPRERHAVDPDAHHKVLCKSTIPEMGASCPYHMSIHDYTIPCMIKKHWWKLSPNMEKLKTVDLLGTLLQASREDMLLLSLKKDGMLRQHTEWDAKTAYRVIALHSRWDAKTAYRVAALEFKCEPFEASRIKIKQLRSIITRKLCSYIWRTDKRVATQALTLHDLYRKAGCHTSAYLTRPLQISELPYKRLPYTTSTDKRVAIQALTLHDLYR
ncbi:predicted protein [Nematostella vectensis]|uniref:Uncharacterized protein n=1 Tax=Nematostella vectensis TaxID=45351 RepID=A7S1T4_NEMVE|nr:predicted protein [Nematostella vectensis]|eukprot:XP_001634359.1 predicted protein [Nematostella vectensis]